MGKKFITQGDPTGSNKVDVEIPKGRYTHLAVTIEGAAVSGDELQKSTIVDARFSRNGTQYQAGSFEDYNQLMNLWSGFPEFTNPTAGSQYAVMFIPMGYPQFPNTADIRDVNEAVLSLAFDADLDNVFGANNPKFKVFGLTDASIPETYRLRMVQRNQQAAGAGRLNDDWKGPNVGALYFRDDADIVDQVQVEVDGQTIEDNIDDDFIRACTSLNNAIEASGFGLAQVEVLTRGLVPSTYNDNVSLSANFNANGTLEVFYLAFEWGTGGDSVQQVQSEIARKARGRSPGKRPAGSSVGQ